MTSAQRRQYIREVCLALYGKEPEETRMSSAEFSVLQGWMDRKIPLAHVLQAYREVRGRLEADVRPVHPLLYIKSAVEAEHERASRRL